VVKSRQKAAQREFWDRVKNGEGTLEDLYHPCGEGCGKRYGVADESESESEGEEDW
jgi:hypothetical protein